MINITRGDKPTSLDKPEIQLYLDEVIVYNQLSKEDKKKAKEPDAGAYRNSDVLEAFDRDFYSKCYLTEQKFENSWAMDVEHFKSKSFNQYPQLKYEWENLYPCTHDANISKPTSEPVGGYLDPCDKYDDVEKEIVYDLMFDGKASFGALNQQNVKALNTAKLLDKVHNGHDSNSIQKTATLRHLISKKSFELIKLIVKWQNFKLKGQTIEEVRIELRLKEILSRKNEFTMLLRSLSSVKCLPKDFLD
jgi:hypothetical protein